MIVITGPGRSGTSLLARMYQELGFDPTVGGGGWERSINGGLEDIAIGELNAQIIAELGMRSPAHRIADGVRAISRSVSRQRLDAAADTGVDDRSSRLSKVLTRILTDTAGRHIHLLQWGRVDAVVARHGDAMRELACNREIVKDPQFCQTLWVWAAAGADISHVTVSIRSVDATGKRLIDSGHLPHWMAQQAPNHVSYRLGLLIAALYDHRLSHAFVHFPDFLREPDALFDALRFPRPVGRDDFIEAFDAIKDPNAIHIWS